MIVADQTWVAGNEEDSDRWFVGGGALGNMGERIGSYERHCTANCFILPLSPFSYSFLGMNIEQENTVDRG